MGMEDNSKKIHFPAKAREMAHASNHNRTLEASWRNSTATPASKKRMIEITGNNAEIDEDIAEVIYDLQDPVIHSRISLEDVQKIKDIIELAKK